MCRFSLMAPMRANGIFGNDRRSLFVNWTRPRTLRCRVRSAVVLARHSLLQVGQEGRPSPTLSDSIVQANGRGFRYTQDDSFEKDNKSRTVKSIFSRRGGVAVKDPHAPFPKLRVVPSTLAGVCKDPRLPIVMKTSSHPSDPSRNTAGIIMGGIQQPI
jgi:hypothetical protein